ncbi:MAG: hypothetical protein C0424_10985 [Sphingobacteriaceae bacterium]|nr:hypothetical protein [Sphingobacteriaceae bacterium]
MRFTLVSNLLGLLLNMQLLAQPGSSCTTPTPLPHHYAFIEQHREGLSTENSFRLPVTLHIIRTSNGSSSFNSQWAVDALCAVNARFQAVGICFYLAGPVRFINRTDLTNPPSFAAASAILDEFNVARTINIYYTNLANFGTCAFAFFPGIGPGGPQNQGGVVMGTNCASDDGALLAHELGHYFNLPHTFNETSDNPRDWLFAERVTRNNNEPAPRLSANCNNSSDRFCDTPADFLPVRWPCPTSITQTDTNGDLFQPDATLYMGYARDSCMQRFSPQQIAVMRATLSTPTAPRAYLLLQPQTVGVSSLTTPQLLQPGTVDSQITVSNGSFQWSRSLNAQWYHFRLFQFTNQMVVDTVVSDTFWQAPNGLLRINRPYRWQVRALGRDAYCSHPSPFFNFTAALNTSVFDTKGTQIKMYPQPSTGFIQLAGFSADEKVRLELYSLQGQRLQSSNLQCDDAGQTTWAYDYIPNGLYTILLHAKSNHYRLRMHHFNP